jgi:hypothetical protein
MQRAFFYLELSKLARVPAFVSQTKQEILEQLDKSVHEAFRKLQPEIDDAVMRGSTPGLLGDVSQYFDIEVPPLVEYIWRHAYREDISLLESALELHDSREAEGFREWLGKIERKLLSRNRPEIREAQKDIQELERRVQEWSNTFDVNLGVKYEKRTGKVGGVPAIGWILDLFGFSEIEYDDPLLTPPERYVSFIANWYKS